MTLEDCLFCRIIRGEVGADIVEELPRAIAFRDSRKL